MTRPAGSKAGTPKTGRRLRGPLVLVALVALVALASMPHQAHAAPGSLSGNRSKPYTHDGFYLRFATGFGAYSEHAWSQPYEDTGRVNVSARGFAVAQEFAMGGTPWEGLTIGGGVFATQVYTSSLSFERDTPPPDAVGFESRDFNLVGVFVDRYFVPQVGVHAQAALGVATQLQLGVDPTNSKDTPYTAVGPGVVLGFGYETWIAEQWSLGMLARFGFSVLFGRESGVHWFHTVTNMPAFLMTLTYH